MAERIYTRAGEGGLEPLEEEAFSNEEELQKLVAEHPELLDGKQIRPDDARRWVVVNREMGIAETANAGAHWAIDLLIVDQDAVPTLAEVKRGSNPEIRRTVVGQMLEYAAHAQTWRVDELRRAFEESCSARGLDPDDKLAWLLQKEEAPDAEKFWRQVYTNLAAGRLRLLFIADDIPEPLKRVVEFLNAHMPEIEVLAVEIKQFRGGSTQTLVPRVIGKTAGHAKPQPKLTPELFSDALPTATARDVADRLLAVAKRQGASLNWGKGSVSVRVRVEGEYAPIWQTVARLAVPGATIFGLPASDIWFIWLKEGESCDYDVAAQNIDLLEARLAKAVSEVRSP
ncbi:MAG: hypothetical protein OXC31_20955 [Spirochaetaceae bacterium]|nr:hypothetical protein [Spirochaetaceae bacterium]